MSLCFSAKFYFKLSIYQSQNIGIKAGIPFIRERDVNVKRERETWTQGVYFHAHTIPFIRLAWKQLLFCPWLYPCTQVQTKI